MFSGAMICWFVFVLASLLVGGAVIVRGAVSISNRSLGANRRVDDDELDEWIGYRQLHKSVSPIPEPDVWKGASCVLLILLVDFVAGLALRELVGEGPFDGGYHDEGALIFWHLLAIILSFPLCAFLIKGVFPTRFPRACLVLMWTYLIPLALAAAIAILAVLFIW
jgi:hypothetical protein